MSDNFTAGGVLFSSKDVSGAQVQRVLNLNFFPGVTLQNTNASLTSVSILAANANRRGLLIFNDSITTLRVAFGVAASLTALSVIIKPGGLYEAAVIYTGQLFGIWEPKPDGTVDSTGAARCTEMTE